MFLLGGNPYSRPDTTAVHMLAVVFLFLIAVGTSTTGHAWKCSAAAKASSAFPTAVSLSGGYPARQRTKTLNPVRFLITFPPQQLSDLHPIPTTRHFCSCFCFGTKRCATARPLRSSLRSAQIRKIKERDSVYLKTKLRLQTLLSVMIT
jgi:hypothetical protein